MKIEHFELVTRQIEAMKDFYVRFFGAKTEYWCNEEDDVKLYFLDFGGTTRIEIKENLKAEKTPEDPEMRVGLGHLAFLCTSRRELHEKLEELRAAGVPVTLEPTDYGTSDFYECSVTDPDGNTIELSVGPQYLNV